MDEASQEGTKERQQRSHGLIYTIRVPWVNDALPFFIFLPVSCEDISEFSEEAVWHLGYSR